MMFNKKMLGSCCVGLALLQSSDVFCAQLQLEVGNETSAKPTTATEEESACQRRGSPLMAIVDKESKSPRKEIPAKESELKEHAPPEKPNCSCTFYGPLHSEILQEPLQAKPIQRSESSEIKSFSINLPQEFAIPEKERNVKESQSPRKTTAIKESAMEECKSPNMAKGVDLLMLISKHPTTYIIKGRTIGTFPKATETKYYKINHGIFDVNSEGKYNKTTHKAAEKTRLDADMERSMLVGNVESLTQPDVAAVAINSGNAVSGDKKDVQISAQGEVDIAN